MVLFLHLFQNRTSGSLWIGITGFSGPRCPSCHPTISVKALKWIQTTNPNYWSGLILPSSTRGRLTEGMLLSWRQYHILNDTAHNTNNKVTVIYTTKSLCHCWRVTGGHCHAIGRSQPHDSGVRGSGGSRVHRCMQWQAQAITPHSDVTACFFLTCNYQSSQNKLKCKLHIKYWTLQILNGKKWLSSKSDWVTWWLSSVSLQN